MSSGELSTEVRDGIVRIAVPGALYDQESCDRLTGMVKHQLGMGFKMFWIDLRACSALSSYGVGQLLTINDLTKSCGGSLTLEGVSKELREILAALMLDQIFQLR